MRRHYIKSSAIKTLGYDAEKEILEIEFHNNGAVWQYHHFPEHLYRQFIYAASKGNFFVTHIKGNFAERKVK